MSETEPTIHPAAYVVLNASPRGGAYISDQDAAHIAAAVLRWAADSMSSVLGARRQALIHKANEIEPTP